MVEKLLKPRSQALIISGVVILVVLYHSIFEWPSSIQVPLKQEAFLIAIEEGDNSAWDTLLSETYEDQWGFSKSNALVALQDVRSQLIGLDVVWTSEDTMINDGAGTLSGDMHFEATGFFGTDALTSLLNGLDEPWIFEWQKESWIPWSWKLVRIENDSLNIGGYRPGDLKKKMSK